MKNKVIKSLVSLLLCIKRSFLSQRQVQYRNACALGVVSHNNDSVRSRVRLSSDAINPLSLLSGLCCYH